jgi:hypothetical protein
MTLFSRCVLLGSIILLGASCATVSYSTQFSQPGFQVKDLLSKKVEVVCGNEMYRTAYDRAFEKRFTDNEGYFKHVQTALTMALKSQNPNVKIGSANGLEALTGLVSLSESDIQNSKDYFKNSESDLIVIIKGARISQRFINNYSPPVQPGLAGTNNSKESCLVTVILSIWDTRTQKKVYEYATTDEANVLFFSYQASLENATSKAIESAVSYIQKNGKVN